MTLCSLSFASETFELKEGAKCADKCAVRTDRQEATWGFGLGLLELEAPVGSSHAENRICHRTPEVTWEEAVAHSTRGKRSSLISERSESDSLGWLLLLKVVTALQDVSWGELCTRLCGLHEHFIFSYHSLSYGPAICDLQHEMHTAWLNYTNKPQISCITVHPQQKLRNFGVHF